MTDRKSDDAAPPPDPAANDPAGPSHDLFSIGTRDVLRDLLEQAARKRDEAARAAAASKDRKPRRRR